MKALERMSGWIAVAIVFNVLLVFAAGARGQEKPAPPPPAKQEQTLPAEAQNEILKLQLRQAALQSEWINIQQRAKEIPAEFGSLDSQIVTILQKALRGMGRDPAKYTVDPKTFVLTANPEPAKPEAPKPEKK
jgi:hypothetical protein